MNVNSEDKIEEGMHIMVVRGDQERIIDFRAKDVIQYGKPGSQQSIELKNVAGTPNYSSFRVKLYNGGAKTKKPLSFLELLVDTEKTSFSTNEGIERAKDNRDLSDDNKSQKMNADDIKELRLKGASGSEILETLISNSSSFSKKTEYSQEKYVKKKEKTYGDTLLFIKPTLSLLADYYFKKDPARILNIRPDSLSQMLSYANVHAHGKYLIYETGCSGLVVAAVLTRLRGMGMLLHVHAGSTPPRQAINFLNFKASDLVPLKSLDVFYLTRPPPPPKVSIDDQSQTTGEPPQKTSHDNNDDDGVASKKPKLDEVTDILPPPPPPSTQDAFVPVKAPASVNRVENESSAALLAETEFSSLIIAGKEHPLSILQRLLPRLLPSAPFVIFSQVAEPLADCYMWLKEKNRAANVHVIENWFRNIQVETERTHPEINMSATGGYFLTGIYTC